MRLAILKPSRMVPTWYYISLSPSPLKISSCRFSKSTIKVSCSSRSIFFSCWSSWCHVLNQEMVSSFLTNYMSSGAGSMYGRFCFVILYAYPFALLMPSGGIIGVFWASASRTWNILSHCPRVCVYIGRPTNPFILGAVYPLNTG